MTSEKAGRGGCPDRPASKHLTGRIIPQSRRAWLLDICGRALTAGVALSAALGTDTAVDCLLAVKDRLNGRMRT